MVVSGLCAAAAADDDDDVSTTREGCVAQGNKPIVCPLFSVTADGGQIVKIGTVKVDKHMKKAEGVHVQWSVCRR